MKPNFSQLAILAVAAGTVVIGASVFARGESEYTHSGRRWVCSVVLDGNGDEGSYNFLGYGSTQAKAEKDAMKGCMVNLENSGDFPTCTPSLCACD